MQNLIILNDNIITETNTLRTFRIDMDKRVNNYAFKTLKVKDFITDIINSDHFIYSTSKTHIYITAFLTKFKNNKCIKCQYRFECPEIFPEIYISVDHDDKEELQRIVKILYNQVNNLREQLSEISILRKKIPKEQEYQEIDISVDHDTEELQRIINIFYNQVNMLKEQISEISR